MVTIKDIADAAGVSATTVSNVVHGYTGRVSKKTAERIQEIIEQSGYIPNLSARSLVSRTSHVIALIFHHNMVSSKDIIIDPFDYLAISQIEASMRESGYYMMLRTCHSPKELLTFLQNWNVDGLFFMGMIEEDFQDMLESIGKPVVLIDSHVKSDILSTVGQEDFQGSYLAAKHLIEHGHRKIGYATPPRETSSVALARYEGFLAALKDSGVEFDEHFLFRCNTANIYDCVTLSQEVYQAMQAGMTGLCVAVDQLAIALISGLRYQGVVLPDQLSMVGFGDLQQCILPKPKLTSIRCDMSLKANLAVEYMKSLLNGTRTEAVHTLIPVSLVERESVRYI